MANPQQEILLRESETQNAKSPLGRRRHQSNTTLYARFVTNWWLTELLSVVIGIASTVALCIVLRKYNGKPAPQSNRVLGINVTLNTFVSILSTLARVALLLAVTECISQLKWIWYQRKDRPLTDLDIFDNASRGPWGGLLLLWKINIRQIASVGALLVIVGLATDPLSQQLVQFESQSVPGSFGNASLPSAIQWYDEDTTNNAYVGNSTALEPPLVMKAAIQNGLYTDTSDILDIQPVCSSGNCTWPSYRSLAICAQSVNVTSSLKTKIVPIAGGLPGETGTQWSISTLNYVIDNAYSLLNLSSAANMQSILENQQIPTPLNFSNSIAFQNRSSTLADVFIIYAQSTESNSPFSATEFVLEWCVQNFTTSVTNGQSTTQRHNSFTDFVGPDSNDMSLFVAATPDNGDNQTYLIDPTTHVSLQNYFRILLQGTASITNDGHPSVTNDATQALFQPFDIFGRKINGVDQIPGRGVGQAGLDRILNNIATGMTNVIRINYNSTSTASIAQSSFDPIIQGTVIRQETFVEVKWGWIAALIVLLFGSVFFVLAVIAQSIFGSRIDIWKSSSLPLLKALDTDADTEIRDKEKDADTGGMVPLSQMEKWAERVSARLSSDRDGEGWKLVREWNEKKKAGK